MVINNLTKSEIDSAIKDQDDFVKIDYLNRFLEKANNFEIKKYILLNLAEISEKRNLYKEAAERFSSAARVSIIYKEKREYFMKETELWIRLRDFEMAEQAFKKAFFYANHEEREELKQKYKNLYRTIGRLIESSGKIQQAIDIYEKALSMRFEKDKEEEIIKSLIGLYEKKGDFTEVNRLKEKLSLR